MQGDRLMMEKKKIGDRTLGIITSVPRDERGKREKKRRYAETHN